MATEKLADAALIENIEEAGDGLDESEVDAALEGSDHDDPNADSDRDENGRFKKGGDKAKPKDKAKEKAKDKDEEGEEEEEEEEGEEEEEEGEEEEEEDDDKKKVSKGQLQRIMRSRDRERARVAALEVENERLRRSGEQQTVPRKDLAKEINAELDELYLKVEDLRENNDKAGAAKVQRQIDEANRRLGTLQSSDHTTREVSRALEVTRVQSVIDHLNETFVELNPNSDDFDQDTVDAVQDLATGIRTRKQVSAADAMKEAARRYFGVDPWDKKALKAYLEAEAPAAPLKKKTDIKKAIEKKNKQPPAVDRGKSDDGSAKISAEHMDVEDWEKLPASTRDRLLEKD